MVSDVLYEFYFLKTDENIRRQEETIGKSFKKEKRNGYDRMYKGFY